MCAALVHQTNLGSRRSSRATHMRTRRAAFNRLLTAPLSAGRAVSGCGERERLALVIQTAVSPILCKYPALKMNPEAGDSCPITRRHGNGGTWPEAAVTRRRLYSSEEEKNAVGVVIAAPYAMCVQMFHYGARCWM